MAASYALYAPQDTGGLRFYVFDGATFVESPDAGADVWDGDWHHVVGTYDGASVRLYVDGVEVGGGTATSIPIGYNLPTSNDLFIGSYNGGYNFAGGIDEVSVFNRALSAAEVQARFAAAVAGESSSGTGVYVNLQTGEATGLNGGITNIRNVIGSSGEDVLVGNGGNALFGGAGRDLLIAGALASQLYGGGGEDILIGGTLNDSSRTNLDAILAEWTRTGAGDDYFSRMARLRAGLLADGTITRNGGGNTLTGERGLDLFFGSLVTDWQVDDGEWVFPL